MELNKENWYAQQSKEQLIIFLKNNDYIIQKLQDKVFLLTGCAGFGDSDGTNGSCVECLYNNPQTFERCNLFQSAFHQYRKEKFKKENH